MMEKISQRNNWIGNKLESMKNEELFELFEEIVDFRNTALLNGDKLRNFEKEFSDNVSHTPFGECMRLVEYEILFEMSRRLYNQQLNYIAPLMKGDSIWYADIENGVIEYGKVFLASYKNGVLDSVSVDFEGGDFDEFVGSAIGSCLFLNENEAKEKLLKGTE